MDTDRRRCDPCVHRLARNHSARALAAVKRTSAGALGPPLASPLNRPRKNGSRIQWTRHGWHEGIRRCRGANHSSSGWSVTNQSFVAPQPLPFFRSLFNALLRSAGDTGGAAVPCLHLHHGTEYAARQRRIGQNDVRTSREVQSGEPIELPRHQHLRSFDTKGGTNDEQGNSSAARPRRRLATNRRAQLVKRGRAVGIGCDTGHGRGGERAAAGAAEAAGSGDGVCRHDPHRTRDLRNLGAMAGTRGEPDGQGVHSGTGPRAISPALPRAAATMC